MGHFGIVERVQLRGANGVKAFQIHDQQMGRQQSAVTSRSCPAMIFPFGPPS